MKFLLAALAHLFVWLWWQLRVDPSGRVHRTGKLFLTVSAVFLAFFTITGTLSNILVGDPALASGSSGGSTTPTTTQATPREQTSNISRKRNHPKSPAKSSGAVPGSLLSVYQAAADQCEMSWEVLAAVGWVESRHGELVAPGVKNGANFAGARGPMQFLGATWESYGVDADGDGKADVYNPIDSIYGASKYLCANGARNNERLRDALFTYNRSNDYVNEVLAVAAGYTRSTYVYPLPMNAVDSSSLGKPHHDYPAIDVFVPTGTPLVAAHGGRVVEVTNDGRCGRGVIIDGADGARYTYCHMSRVDVAKSSNVSAGDALGATGGSIGAPGAGSSTTPHLHLQIELGSSLVCPQSLMIGWSKGESPNVAGATRTGCSY